MGGGDEAEAVGCGNGRGGGVDVDAADSGFCTAEDGTAGGGTAEDVATMGGDAPVVVGEGGDFGAGGGLLGGVSFNTFLQLRFTQQRNGTLPYYVQFTKNRDASKVDPQSAQ